MGCELGYLNELPVGYRFRPNDDELMEYYLGNKVLDKPVPGKVVKTIDADEFYKYPPHTIVDRAKKDNPLSEIGEREWYFFVQHVKKTANKQQEGKKEEIVDENKRVLLECNKKNQEDKATVLLEQNKKDQETKATILLEQNKKNQETKATILLEGNKKNQENKATIDEENKNVRRVGDRTGYWKSTGIKQHIINDGNNKVFAFKIHFTFYKGIGKITHWTMDEYHLLKSPNQENQRVHLQMDEWVLIKIMRGKDYNKCC